LAFALIALAAPAAGSQPVFRYFKVKVVSSGSYVADYGRDRFEPGLTTAAGVDGKESASWRWEVQTIARSVNGGPLQSGAEIVRLTANLSHKLVSYTVQMGELGESRLCNKQRFNTKSDIDPPGRPAPRGDWIPRSAPVSVSSVGVSSTSSFGLPTCLHGYSGHGLKFVDGSGAKQAPVPRGAFNPLFDRRFSRSYSDTAQLGLSHSGDPNSAHTFAGQSHLTVKIKALSERAAKRKNRRYGRYPKGGLSDSK
jgi:hypothetical protein